MIESGSLVRGVDPRGWGVPAGSALRIERPAPDLAPLLTEYTVSASDASLHADARSLIMPGWPTIRFALSAGPGAITIGPRRYDQLPTAMLLGTSSRTTEFVTNGGTFVMVGISPLGWSRLFRFPADRLRDRLLPLGEVMAPEAVAQLQDALTTTDLARDLPSLLNAFFRVQLLASTDKEDAIRGLIRIISTGSTEDIATASEMLGLPPNALRRLSTRYFGFPPKLLLVRARFIQSMIRMMLSGSDGDYSDIAATYFDKSHFLRDANRFLGTTPKRFMRLDQRFMTAFLRARREVFGGHPLAAAAADG